MSNKPLNILLADDDEDDRLFFKEALENIKIKTVVTTVNDGIELMEYLNKSDIKYPDIVFLDLNMPRKNGIQCLEEIRKDKNLKNLTVAIYSTSGSESDIEETLIKGANVYIRKPNDFSALKKVVSETISINWQFHNSGLNKETFLLSI
ncbi:MAG: response regulator [Chitinophagales bacterium]